MKGKITCPKCGGRLGSFNFTQPRKCAGTNSVAQPVWLMKSRVDLGIQAKLHKPKPISLDETWTIISHPVPDKLSPECSRLVLDSSEEARQNVNCVSASELKLLKENIEHPISCAHFDETPLASQR